MATKKASAVELVGLRNEFYRDGWRQLLAVTAILAISLLVSLIVNVWFALHPAQREYFGVDSATGRMFPVAPLDTPYATTPQVLAWAAQCAQSAYNMDAVNYVSQVQSNRPCFTDDGYSEYVNALKTSGQVDFIKNNKLISSAIPQKAPIVVNDGLVNGVYLWKIRVPLLVTYANKGESATKVYMVTMVISRRPVSENVFGLGITKFTVADA